LKLTVINQTKERNNMKTYNIKFITNSEQKEPFAELFQAESAREARARARCEVQIPARFILSCEVVNDSK
jgi:hypothetical protein